VEVCGEELKKKEKQSAFTNTNQTFFIRISINYLRGQRINTINCD